MDIFKLKPAFKSYIWGGDKLKTTFSKKSDEEIIAESWELSCHKDGQSVVETGKYQGLTLSQVIETESKEILGTKAIVFDDFPILIKLIDSREDLSIQVHPDDLFALKEEKQFGKTEMWYVLDCEEDAFLYFGLKEKVSKEKFVKAIEENTVLDLLNKETVHKGDVFFIEPGTIHAIGKGIVIAEVQQNSNVTYRIYDYDRKQPDGTKRELHLEKAMKVAKLEKAKKHIFDNDVLAKCNYFKVKVKKISGEEKMMFLSDTFQSFLVIDGFGDIVTDSYSLDIKKGDSLFVPAGVGEFWVKGDCEILITTL